MIIPEHDVWIEEDVWKFNKNQLGNINDLCELLWSESSVEVIQSCLEFDGGPISTNKVKRGSQPSINPISIIDEEIYNRIDNLKSSIEKTLIKRNGIMLFDKGLVK